MIAIATATAEKHPAIELRLAHRAPFPDPRAVVAEDRRRLVGPVGGGRSP